MRWWSRRRRAVPDCPRCGHGWDEHAGGGADDDEAQTECGECQYEAEHGFLPPDADLCHLHAHHSRVQVLLSDVHLRLRAAGASATWAPPSPHWRTGRVEVVLPGGSEVAIVEDDDAVHVVVDHVVEHHLDVALEAELLADPMAFLEQLAAPSTGRHPQTARGRVAELLREHRAAPFPARLRGEEVAGVDAVVVDADVVGIVVTWLDGGQRLSRTHERLLPRLMADLEAVLDELEDPDEVTHYRRLRTMARGIISASQRRTGR